MINEQAYDVAVVGAGVFGAWIALQLSRSGAQVVLVDAYGPGNSRASSGGESRIIRMGYGPDQIYTRMAQRSLALWQELPASAGMFQPTGVLWLARENDPYCEATLETLTRFNVRFERLERDELSGRYSQLELGPIAWGILEPDSGVLFARRAVQFVVNEARKNGATYLEEAVLPPGERGAQGGTGRGEEIKRTEDSSSDAERIAKLNSVSTLSGRRVSADKFVFACGPWLPKLFPALLAELIHVTRQEVFFLGVPPGDNRFGAEQMPVWIDFNDLVYGFPNLDNRGVKVAIDEHGVQFDPDEGERIVSPEGLSAVRDYLGRRLPSLATAPVTETRVCQYENTSNGDFLIDRHPGFTNVWLAGGGSGHGFKHGPAVGEYVAALISGKAMTEPRFALATKERVQERRVY